MLKKPEMDKLLNLIKMRRITIKKQLVVCVEPETFLASRNSKALKMS